MSSKHSAFTLVEVLVALLVSSMVLFIGTLSLKQTIDILHKNQKTLPITGMEYFWLKKVIASTFAYAVFQKKTFKQNEYDYSLFFSGSNESITFISNSPLFSNTPAIVNLSLEDDHLYYAESPLYDHDSDFNYPKITKPHHKYDFQMKLKNPKFEYETNQTITTKMFGSIPDTLIIKFEQDGKPFKYIFAIPANYPENTQNMRKYHEEL